MECYKGPSRTIPPAPGIFLPHSQGVKNYVVGAAPSADPPVDGAALEQPSASRRIAPATRRQNAIFSHLLRL